MNVTKKFFLGVLLVVAQCVWADEVSNTHTLSIDAKEGDAYVLLGSDDGLNWTRIAMSIATIDGSLDVAIPENADYARYRLVEFANPDSVGDRILSDKVMNENVFPDWFYGFSHGNYFNVGILACHATNLFAPQFIVPVAWVSIVVNTLSIAAAYVEGFHADAPHLVEVHKTEYGHPELWMAATTSSLVDADWISGYTSLSGWTAVFFFNAMELATGSSSWTSGEFVAMWAGMFGDLTMSSYDFWGRVVRYSEVTLSSNPDEQAMYIRAWDGAWVYAAKLASAILPLGMEYFKYKAVNSNDYWQGTADTLKWTGRAASALGAAGYLYSGLGTIEHVHTDEKAE